jgi:ribosomal protein L29
MTAPHLNLADELTLPLDVVTQKLAWLGVTGSGKTYGASKLAELLWHAGAQFVAVDPVGTWYGLRLAKDGKKPSALTVPIFGGLHGDVPLEPTAGALLANLVVDKTLSAILDVSQFESDADKARFARDFADRFFFRKKAAPSAVHVFLEECQEFVPQNPQKGEERMLHAFIRLQKLGRNFGIGSSYISQRPQEVNKKALNMAQTLFVFRTTGTHERAAIEKWIEDKALDEDIAGDLPKIATGDCHVWSPEFLKISETVHILEKATFNASATPEVGVKATTRELAPIDLEQVRTAMAATIEKAKAEDPRELRKQIAELKAQLSRNKTVANTQQPVAPKRIEVLTDADRALLEKVGTALQETADKLARAEQAMFAKLGERLHTAVTDFTGQIDRTIDVPRHDFAKLLESKGFQKILEKLSAISHQASAPQMKPQREWPKPEDVAPRRSFDPPARRGPASAGLDDPQRKILDVVAMLRVRGIDATRESVARWLSIHPNGGRYGTNLASLRAEGYLDGFRLTEKGEAAARAMETGLTAAKDPLDGSQRDIVDVLASKNGHRFTRETLAEELGLHPNGGRYGTNLARLRTMGLLPERGDIYLTDGAKA